MTRILTGQTNFNKGQLSPELWSRIDVDQYDNGIQVGTNVLVTGRGPIKRRNGFKAICPVKDSSAEVKLVRFQFANDDCFILEFGNTYIRFFQDDAPVTTNNAAAISGISQASPGVVTATSHGLSNGDQIFITGVVGMTEVNDKILPYKVSNVTANTFDLTDYFGNAVDTSSYTAYSSGGTIKEFYEVTSPYSTADLDNLSYVQFGDLIYIAHPSYAPRIITRTATTTWTIDTLDLDPPPTYESGFQPGTTVTPAATTGTSVNFTTGVGAFLQADVGRQIVNESTGETGRAIITSITSATVAVCDIVEDFTDTNAIASGDWTLDLSPVAELNFSGTASGSIITVTANYTTGFKGSTIAISGITAANPAVVTTSSSHGLSSGDTVFIDDVSGMSMINGRTLDIAVTGASTFSTKEEDTGTSFNASNFTAYSSGGTVQKVFTGIAVDCFRAADVGKYIIANDGVLEIIEYISEKEVKCEVKKSLSSSDYTNNWTLETETWTSARGYPRAVGLYQQRLVFAGTSAVPQGVWFSEIGIFNGFGRGSNDADAISIEISSREVNQINWLSNSNDLIIGTAGSEITIDAPSSSSGLSASNIRQLPRRYHGSPQQTPVTIGSETLFIQNAGRKIRALRYDFNIDGYLAEDLTYLAEDITSGIVKEIAYAGEPDDIIYAVTEDGNILCGTYKKEQEVMGWTKWTFDGTAENIQTITEDNRDKVYTVFNRTINSNTLRMIEILDSSTGEDRLDGFSDSYITHSSFTTITGITKANPAVVTSTSHGLANGDRVKLIDVGGMTEVENITFLVANKTANTFELTDLQGNNINSSAYTTYTSGGECHKLVNTISNLDHLEGETVQVKLDGAVATNQTVSSGSISLGEYCFEATVGKAYTSTVTLLNKNFNIGQGVMQGQRSRYVRPLLRLYKSTLPLLNGEFTPSRNTNDLMDVAVPLHTGDFEYGNLDWGNTGQLTFTVSAPLPMLMTGVFGTIEGNVK